MFLVSIVDQHHCLWTINPNIRTYLETIAAIQSSHVEHEKGRILSHKTFGAPFYNTY